MRKIAEAKRGDIDAELKAEAIIPFEASLQATVERIQDDIERAAISGRSNISTCTLHAFNVALSDAGIGHAGSRIFVGNTLTMGDFISRNICQGRCAHTHFDTYFSGMSDNRLETLQKSRNAFPLWLADKLAPIFRKAGYKVDNRSTIDRKCNTKYVTIIHTHLNISW
tara:strand:+ start:156 stop:659 length:504 start_codon:yes stop_codon:yes gene_type:complete